MKKLRLPETIGSEVLHLVAKLDLEANVPQSQSDLITASILSLFSSYYLVHRMCSTKPFYTTNLDEIQHMK